MRANEESIRLIGYWLFIVLVLTSTGLLITAFFWGERSTELAAIAAAVFGLGTRFLRLPNGFANIYANLTSSLARGDDAQIATVMGEFAKRRGRVVHSATAILLISAGLLLLLEGEAARHAAFALAAAAILLESSFVAFLWRLKRGLYGTTEYEARQVVRFILANAEDIDFSGGLGTRDMAVNDESLVLAERSWGFATR